MVKLHIEYDGSLDGFLTVLGRSYKTGVEPLSISVQGRRVHGLFDTSEYWESDQEQAERLTLYLQNMDPKIFTLVVHAYLCEQSDVALAAYSFIGLCLKMGPNVLSYHSHDAVRNLLKNSKALEHEIHSFTGLVRFRELETGVFYGPLEPVNNIVFFVAEHFIHRLPLQEWVLHDVARNIALFWDTKRVRQVGVDVNFTEYVRCHGDVEEKSHNEEKFQKLWQVFHTSIANPKRANKKLQRQFIPQRYWKYLIEKDI